MITRVCLAHFMINFGRMGGCQGHFWPVTATARAVMKKWGMIMVYACSPPLFCKSCVIEMDALKETKIKTQEVCAVQV